MGNSCSKGTDANVGSAQTKPSSASALISTLVPVLVYAIVWFALFLILRNRFPRYYRPRTFVNSLNPELRTPKPSDSIFGWISEFWAMPDTYVLNHHTLDGYLFLRFLKIAIVCCLVGMAITWPILFPINITGGGGLKQLDILTMGNVTGKTEGGNYFKLFAHAGCACIYFCFILYMITRECVYYINLRQAYLMSPLYASRISSRTVLYTSVPEAYMNEAKLRRMLEPGVRRIWLATDCKDLTDKVEERDKVAMKLEGAETKLIKIANGNRLKAEKKGERQDSEEGAIGQNGSASGHYIQPKERPTHRLKPLIGKKVDTIEWTRGELQRLIPEVDAAQNEHKNRNAKMLNSVFVEFETMSQAQAAYQSLTHHQILQMAPRFTGMTPEEVIWSNLGISWWQRVVRKVGTTAFVTALVIFWSIPVAFVGAISHVDNLVCMIPAFRFILDIPPVILGVVTGLLPVVLLAALMALLPIILRAMAKIGGAPTESAVELTVQNTYFAFQIVQVFLVATIGASASAAVSQIVHDPTSAPSLLAKAIPKASQFYLSYFILQGLGIVSGLMLGLVGLVIFMILGKILDTTPRKMYKRWISLSGLGWGTLFPVYTNLFVIAICYAVVAPLVLGFAAIGLFLFYFAYRYNLLFVSNVVVDTKGLVYPRALGHLFIGLYVAEVCLIGLFAIATAGGVGALGPLIMMVIMLIFTTLYQLNLNTAMAPLIKFLPKSLDAEERRLLEVERGDHNDVEDDRYAADGARKEGYTVTGREPSEAPPHKKPNFLTKWLRPDIYTDYETMRRLVPKEIAIHYSAHVEETAFYHPSISSPAPLLWIPRDPMGISKEEVATTSKTIPITDEGAVFDEKNKIVWNADDGRPPIYEEKVYY